MMDQIGGDLRLVSLRKEFGDFVAVDDIDILIPKGSFFALLGPSGCGKTTTLRMVAGLELPTAGQILIGDHDIAPLKPYNRPVNTVFQSYALFPHLDIYENVAFGLRRRGIKDVSAQVDAMLSLVELDAFARRKPSQLSGGQQQRVALARALINRPEVLLLDEPLGALDLKLRRQMQLELKRIQTEVGITFVHVTHDQEEAMTMADTIAVMNQGKVEQLGSPMDLYENPRTTFVANFLGQSNLLTGEVVERGDFVGVKVWGNQIKIPASRVATSNSKVWVGVRPEKIYISAESNHAHDHLGNQLVGTVLERSYIGVSTQFIVEIPGFLDDEKIIVFEQNVDASEVMAGDRVRISWDPAHTFALDAKQDAYAGDVLAETE
ncbi:MAG: polyamine ABC transporter ATP-binding protein [Actinobacteria bacterium]|nr:polyamine ABC transporter ATP-binding protein [Actinomycetota bacterium]